jgi:hypothetical protein
MRRSARLWGLITQLRNAEPSAFAVAERMLVGSAISGCVARKGADRRLANIAVRFDGSQSMIRKSV